MQEKKKRQIRLPRNVWHSVNDNLKPKEYSLVRLKDLSGRVFSGWRTKEGWDGARMRKGAEIIEWLRPSEYMY